MEQISQGQGGDAGELRFPVGWSRLVSRKPCLTEDMKGTKERATRVSEKRVILVEDSQCKDPEVGGAGLENSRKSKEASVAGRVSLLREGQVREGRRGEVRSRRGNDTEGVTLTQRAEALEGLELRSEILWSVFSKSTLDADWGTGQGRQEPRDQVEATAAMQAGGDEGLDDGGRHDGSRDGRKWPVSGHNLKADPTVSADHPLRDSCRIRRPSPEAVEAIGKED